MEQAHAGYLISDDPERLDAIAIHAYLTRAYWSEGISLEVVESALKHSMCIGAYEPNRAQVGLVRIITDQATYAYLCDVYVLELHRRRGLAKALLTFALNLPPLQGLRSWNLRTRDAHPLYEQFGFKVAENPENQMSIRCPDIYRKNQERKNS